MNKKYSMPSELILVSTEEDIFSKFKSEIKQALLNSSNTEIEDAKAWNLKAREKLFAMEVMSPNDLKIMVVKDLISGVKEFIASEDFQDNKLDQYLEVLGERFSPNIFAFLLWREEKKDCAYKLFKSYDINLSSDKYDLFMNVVKDTLPSKQELYNPVEYEIYLEKKKSDFLYYQKNYKLLESLEGVPTQEQAPSKKVKI